MTHDFWTKFGIFGHSGSLAIILFEGQYHHDIERRSAASLQAMAWRWCRRGTVAWHWRASVPVDRHWRASVAPAWHGIARVA